MKSIHMKVLYRNILVIVLSFSLSGSFPGGEAFWGGPHHIGKIRDTSDTAHVHHASAHSHPPCGQESHQGDSSEEFCQIPYKNHAESAQVSILPNRTKRSQRHLVATLTARTATICSFQPVENRLISAIFHTPDPTLSSLRTVILLA